MKEDSQVVVKKVKVSIQTSMGPNGIKKATQLTLDNSSAIKTMNWSL